MLALNWVDLIIIVLIAGSGYVSSRIGFFRQFCLLAGFFAGLILAGWLFPYLIPIKDPTLFIIANANLVLLFAIYTGVRGFDLGNHIKTSFKHKYHNRIEAGLGVLIGCAAMLLVVWLGAVGLTRMPFAGLSNSVSDAYILQQMNYVLPSVPSVFAKFSKVIDPNSAPKLYTGHQPKPSLVTRPLTGDLKKVAEEASSSVVRVTGFGCGGIVSGSGFVVAPNLVVTNAHVVAGVKRPIVKSDNTSYVGTPILFNPSIDFAVLYIQDLHLPPLELGQNSLTTGDPIVVLGYPRGNFAEQPGYVISNTQIFGANIYGLGTIARDVYHLQFNVEEGNSGGPVLSKDKEVVGVALAKVGNTNEEAYALTAKQVRYLVDQAQEVRRKVSTGACII